MSTSLPRCRCGHDRNHPEVKPVPRYSPVGWLFLCAGVSKEPIRVEYTCQRCQTVLATTTDPDVLRKHT